MEVSQLQTNPKQDNQAPSQPEESQAQKAKAEAE
jgi:hypothetical protein